LTALDQLHDDRPLVAFADEVVNGQHVRMVHTRHGLGLGPKATQDGGIARQRSVQQLQRDRPPQHRVASGVDDAVAPFAECALEHVLADAFGLRHGGSVRQVDHVRHASVRPGAER